MLARVQCSWNASALLVEVGKKKWPNQFGKLSGSANVGYLHICMLDKLTALFLRTNTQACMYGLCHSIQNYLKKKKREETTHIHGSGYRSNRILCDHENEQTTSLPSNMHGSQESMLSQETTLCKVSVHLPKWANSERARRMVVALLLLHNNRAETYSFHLFLSHCTTVDLHIHAHTHVFQKIRYT